MMKILLSILLVMSATTSFAQTSAAAKKQVSIGTFEQNQQIVHKFMGFVGWNEETTFEETDLKMINLLNKLITEQKDVKEWIHEVNTYFESEKYKNSTADQKREDIFKAKIFAKMSISHYGLIK